MSNTREKENSYSPDGRDYKTYSEREKTLINAAYLAGREYERGQAETFIMDLGKAIAKVLRDYKGTDHAK